MEVSSAVEARILTPRSDFVQDQKYQVHADRRTRRDRDRSNSTRQAVERSEREE
jgi:hypothetical protein